MDELYVSVSNFRVHLKDLANAVARGEQRVLVARHGFQMVALVSQEDLAYLRKHRPGLDATARKRAGIPDILEHPENLPFEEVQRLYAATKGMTDRYIENWRGKAYILIKLRTGQLPDDPPSLPRPSHQNSTCPTPPPSMSVSPNRATAASKSKVPPPALCS